MTEKSTSERLADAWHGLSHNQRRFVVAMQESSNKREAAEAIGLEPNTVYRWPDAVDVAIDLMAADIQQSAVVMLSESVAKAAMIKVAGLDSQNEKIRQDAATEILDRVQGKAVQRSELTGKNGQPIDVRHLSDDELLSIIED